MRRIVPALLIALLAIAFIAPAVEAGASVPRGGALATRWSWLQQLVETIWISIAAADASSDASSPGNAAASGPDQGPDMDPNS